MLINDIYAKLSFGETEMIEELSDLVARDPCDIIFFLQTPTRKDLWHSEASVIVRQDDSIIERYIMNLLDWLFDLNWPGADLLYDRIVKMPANSKIDRAITETIAYASKCAEFNMYYNRWIHVLESLQNDRKMYNKK